MVTRRQSPGVAVEEFDALSDRELKRHLATAHRLVFESLSRKTRLALEGEPRRARTPRPGRG